MKYFYLSLALILSACSAPSEETLTSGATHFLVESSDSVAISQQWDIFSNDYPKASIEFRFMPENRAIGAFLQDSSRVLICDRKLSSEEEEVIKSRDIKLRSYLIAAKSIAIIVHPSNPLASINQDDLKLFFKGELKKTENYTLLVADGNNSIFSHLKRNYGKPRVKKAGTEQKVIDKVANNPKTIGLVPVDYLIDRTTNRKNKNLKRVKAIPIRNNQDQKLYSAATPNMKGLKYPLVQEVYLHDAQGKSGLGTGLAGFMLSDRGQLMFKKMGWYAVRARDRDLWIAN